ncbi:MAG: hypothetical protein RBR81_05020 [Bacteroidales bacterium]|nr:hypothetical protein [Bacteroidales bacterium]
MRSFVRFFAEQNSRSDEISEEKRRKSKKSGVSKEIGEYVDYEEVD